MKCKHCGNELKGNERFCMQCGNENVAEPNLASAPVIPTVQQPIQVLPHMKTKKKKGFLIGFVSAFLACLLLCTMLLATGVASIGKSSGKTAMIEGNGYSTPEEAAQAYADALQKVDVAEMASTFAVESYVENYDFEAFTQRIQTYNYSSSQRLPTTTQFSVALNTMQRQDEIARSIYFQYIALFMGDSELLENGFIFFEKDVTEIEDFVTEIGNEEYLKLLSTLKVKNIYDTDDLIELGMIAESFNSSANQKNIKEFQNIFGTNKIVPLAVLVTINRTEYFLCMDIAKYGDKYYVLRLGGYIAMFANLSAMSGGVVPKEFF